MILLSLFVTTFAVMVATSSAIELRGGFLRTTELLQQRSYSDCVKSCTDYFNNKSTDGATPNTRNAANWCHDAKGLYGLDFHDCMKDYKERLESIGGKNGFVGVWCTQRICKKHLAADGSVGVE